VQRLEQRGIHFVSALEVLQPPRPGMVVAKVRPQEQSAARLEHPGQLSGRRRLVLDVVPGQEHERVVGAGRRNGQVLGRAGPVLHAGGVGLVLRDLAHALRRLDADGRPEGLRQRGGEPAGP
jgi:hypothetical protein